MHEINRSEVRFKQVNLIVHGGSNVKRFNVIDELTKPSLDTNDEKVSNCAGNNFWFS